MAEKTVIRDVCAGVWTFSKPFSRGPLPVGGRSTAVSLSGDRILALASTPMDEDTKAKLDQISNGKGLAYIAALDDVHHMYIKEWADYSPEAKLIGVAASPSKVPSVKWHKLFGRDEDPLAELNGELLGEYCTGFINKDVAFYHAASKTMIQADLLFNLPAYEQYSASKKSATGGLTGSFCKYYNPYGAVHRTLLGALVKDKKSMGASAKKIAAWDFERIIPCHGEVIEGPDAKKAWTSLYDSYIKAASS